MGKFVFPHIKRLLVWQNAVDQLVLSVFMYDLIDTRLEFICLLHFFKLGYSQLISCEIHKVENAQL